MKRNLLLSIHSIAGLTGGLFILLLSLSGAALVFHEELDGFQKPGPIIMKQTATSIGIDSSFAIIKNKYPLASISNCEIPANKEKPYSFALYDPSYKNGEKPLQVFLHPKTGEVLSTRGGSDDPRHNFMSWLSAFHNSFHLGKKGEWLLGFFSVVFIISILTGIWLYRKNTVAVLSFKRQAYRRKNLHQLIGTWTLIFNLMIAVTGFWMQRYVFKKEFYTADSWVRTLKPSPTQSFSIDHSIGELKNKYPTFTAHQIYFAQSKKGKTAVYGSRSSNAFIHSEKLADVIYLDSTGAVAATGFVDEIDAASRYDIINSQVHFGKYGGWPVKVLYSLFGLLSGILSISGFLLWLKRKSFFAGKT